ncbi:MAG: hypothetical protein H6765_01590 [Candidatus Peribacteria bacterium]|nr:MAG: hypothetical protein H6765_01590 [Candidatus Peribacteria bacterium]
MYVVRLYSKRRGLNFKLLLSKFPLYLVIVYLLGTYSRYLIHEFVIFPLNWEYILLYLTPYDYRFHFV